MTITHIEIAACTFWAGAQTESPDSLAADSVSTDLQEIVIEAPKVIRKADMDVYHPSQSAINNSKNGMQLLNNLMIPTLSVNDALGSIKAAGQPVQIRINGRESSIDQVRTLLPETIKRVEWIDNPGLRYGGANYVLNFIVTNPTVGGSLMTNARQALNEAWGFYMADAKFNIGRSQWEVGGNYKLTNKIRTHREYSETFTYPDGTSLTRDEKSLGGFLDNSQSFAWASYNYIKPDTTVLMAEFYMSQNVTDKWVYNGLLTLSNGADDIRLTDAHGSKGGTPSLSLYWQQSLPRKQMLIVNFNSSFYFGRSFSDYLEQLPGATNYLTDIHTNIKDRNQAYAVEANYIKNWSILYSQPQPLAIRKSRRGGLPPASGQGIPVCRVFPPLRQMDGHSRNGRTVHRFPVQGIQPRHAHMESAPAGNDYIFAEPEPQFQAQLHLLAVHSIAGRDKRGATAA